MFSQKDLDHLSLPEVFEEYIRLKLSNAYAVIKNKAQVQGIPFDFTIDDLAPFPLTCPVLGIPLDYFKKGSGGSNHSPSIDRLVPDEGYVRGNVRIISQKANRLKQDATVSEQIKILSYSTGVSADDFRGLIKEKAL
jgi:hypothetical protein